MAKRLDLLRAVYSASLRPGGSNLAAISDELAEPSDEIQEAIRDAIAGDLLSSSGAEFALTGKGRAELKVVMVGGAFEIIHPGHIHTLTEARSLGNTLVVVVATDRSVAKNKGREPVTGQESRVELVSSLRVVDAAIPGGQGSIYDIMSKIKPDTVALGYDQKHDPAEIEREARRRGLEVKVVRLTTPIPDMKTSKIVSSI